MSRFLFFCFILFSSSVFAIEDTDYDFRTEDWNGTQGVFEMTQMLGYDASIKTTLDFSTLKVADVLVIFYPLQELKVKELTRFVIDGGRILIADDFGWSESFLKRLDIYRVSSNLLRHRHFYNNRLEAPIFLSDGTHPLLHKVNAVVGNHPAALLNNGGPVLKYDDGTGFVYDMNLGKGKVIVVADPSIFINQMLALKDNRIFVENTFRYLCKPHEKEGCNISTFSKDFEQKGSYVSKSEQSSILLNVIDATNKVLGEVSALILSPFLFFFSMLFLVSLGMYLLTIIPVVKTREYSSYVKDFSSALPRPQSEFDWNLSRFGNDHHPRADILPMAILKELFEKIFLKELGYWPSQAENRPDIKGMVVLFSERFLSKELAEHRILIEKDLIELLFFLANIPPRHRVFLEDEKDVQKGDLQKYHVIAMELITIMGRQNDYKHDKWGTS